MKPPKLYRKVWLKLYWLTDTCEGGEHVQRDGINYVEVKRVLDEDNNWFWQIHPWYKGEFEEEITDCDPECWLDYVVYKFPFNFDERNLGYSFNRRTIKEQLEDDDCDDCPF